MIKSDKHNLISVYGLKTIGLNSVFLCGLLILFAFDPVHSKFFPPCPFHTLTGFNCPGCGSLRAVHQMLHGHFLAAFALNPLMLIFTFSMVLIFVGLRLKGKSSERLRELLSRASIGWTVLIIIVIYWFCRNIPVYPFTLLGLG